MNASFLLCLLLLLLFSVVVAILVVLLLLLSYGWMRAEVRDALLVVVAVIFGTRRIVMMCVGDNSRGNLGIWLDFPQDAKSEEGSNDERSDNKMYLTKFLAPALTSLTALTQTFSSRVEAEKATAAPPKPITPPPSS